MMESLDRGKEAFPICGRKIDEVLQLAEGRRRPGLCEVLPAVGMNLSIKA